MCVVSLILCCFAQAASDGAIDTMSGVREGYLNNRESFTSLSCTFDYLSGQTTSKEDAAAGTFVNPPIVRHGVLLVRDGVTKYELLCSDDSSSTVRKQLSAFEKMPAAQRPETISVQCTDRRLLFFEGYSLRYSPLIASANVFGPEDGSAPGATITPFSMDTSGHDGKSDEAQLLSRAISGELPFQVGAIGEGVHGNTLTISAGDREITFALERGYLPIKVISRLKGVTAFEVDVLEIKEVGKSQWIPTLLVNTHRPDSGKPLFVNVLRVKDVSTVAPADDELSFTIAEGTQVHIVGRKAWYNAKQKETVSADTIESMYQRAIGHGKEWESRRAGRRTPSFTARARQWTWQWFAVFSALCAAGIIAGKIRSRRFG